jgi:hypothetical protein
MMIELKGCGFALRARVLSFIADNRDTQETVVGRDRTRIVLNGAVAAAKTLLISDALVDGLDGETGRGRQRGVFLEHPPD